MVVFGQECSSRERRADEATRGVVTYLKCEFMKERVGETFAGVVTGVTDFGLFVQLEGLQVDGLIHVATLGQDYYRYEEDRRTLVGERSGQRFTLGDKLTVRVTRVDPSDRKIDLELVAQTEVAFHPRRKAGKKEVKVAPRIAAKHVPQKGPRNGSAKGPRPGSGKKSRSR
jgi:ribonuclease R